MSTTETTAGHEHSFPCPPGGTFWAPGPCSICGKTWDRAQAERQLREAQEAMAALDGGSAPVSGGPQPCDCGPDERCFECATDDEAAAAVPPWPSMGGPS